MSRPRLSPPVPRSCRSACTESFSFRSYGARIVVRTDDPTAIGPLTRLLPPVSEPLSPIDDGYGPPDAVFSLRMPAYRPGRAAPDGGELHLDGKLHLDDELLVRTADRDELFEAFERNVRIAVGARSRSGVFVHAGVVAFEGRAVLLPGPSHSGKSELVRALLEQGATYFSDEYAVVAPAGTVEPYARPLSLRLPDDPGRHRIEVEHLDAPVGLLAAPIGLIVFTRYDEHARWRPRRLSPGEAALGLVGNAVAARTRSPAVLATAAALSRSVPAYESPRRDASSAATHVQELLVPGPMPRPSG